MNLETVPRFWTYAPVASTPVPAQTSQRDRVVCLVREESRPMLASQVAAMLCIPKPSVARALWEACALGELRRVGCGLYVAP